ncbi:hypothetical protein EBH_0072680 [Eimeria brunetti]|uniref:Uncharacterized protein n=1 Tax=Eimeria brunetti TaxID=51314 RepID=U6LN02_9EIME|nr:hypothetical protein EBH_0072680 [Eimeria brunetti]
MDDQWLQGGPWWKELNEQLGARDGARLDLQDAADNIEEISSGPFLSWRQRGRRTRSAKAAVIAVLVVLVSGARYIMSKKSQAQQTSPTPQTPQLSQLPLDDGSMHQYLYEFNRAADEMHDAWEASEIPVQQAFQEFFTPSLEDGQELFQGPLTPIFEHVEKMRECEVPPESDVEARGEFAQHLQLLRNVCRVATLRLKEMEFAVNVNKHMMEPAPAHEKFQNNEDVPATYFPRPSEVFGSGSMDNVDKKIADNLMLLMAAEDKHDAYNFVARNYFDGFLKPVGEDDAFDPARSAARYQVPYSGKPFLSGAFAEAAEHVFRDSTPIYWDPRQFHRDGAKWTNEEVLEATKRQQEGISKNFERRLSSKREQMRALLQEGVPQDDLLISALFLL